jgi:Flp pilus assembly protein CpaB
MRSRGLVVAIAVVLAVLAAVGVIVYTNQVRTQVEVENTVPVLVSNQDIPANTNLDALIADGAFEFVRVPENALVADAVTTEEQLTGRTTTAPIFAREQITESRLSGGDSSLSVIGVSEGHLGLTVSLEAARGGGGIVQRGDTVAVFATFEEGTVVTREALRTLLSPNQIQRFFDSLVQAGAATNLGQSDVFLMPFKFTVVLVPSVDVLSIQNPTVDEQGRQDAGELIQMSLDMLPEDARNLVFASETATIWVGLLPPSDAEEGYPIEGQFGVDADRLVGVVRP